MDFTKVIEFPFLVNFSFRCSEANELDQPIVIQNALIDDED